MAIRCSGAVNRVRTAREVCSRWATRRSSTHRASSVVPPAGSRPRQASANRSSSGAQAASQGSAATSPHRIRIVPAFPVTSPTTRERRLWDGVKRAAVAKPLAAWAEGRRAGDTGCSSKPRDGAEASS
jgi:hypothetical protein